MRVVAELDERIVEAASCWRSTLRRVTEAGLNTLNARGLVEWQLCYLGCLIKHHDRVVAPAGPSCA
jgi:hypothetical protein